MRCRTCLYPDTKPDIYFDETGQCSACKSYENRPNIDWDSRKKELLHLLDKHDGKCIVPSSGGKDSTWQVLTLLELGADVTIVTATTDHLSDIGKRNIQNLARYANTIEVTPNQEIRRKISRIGLRTVGDISYGEHMAIWSTPFQMSDKLGIPLVFYGECPQNELGGPVGTDDNRIMDSNWIHEFGGFLGLRARDLVGQDGIKEKDIAPYLMPAETKTEAYFLGQFLPWDGYRNAVVARRHGFEWWHEEVEGSVGRYESLDNHQTGIHEWFKYLKYGYMRPTDICSIEIRRGRMTREEGLKVIKEREVYPLTYLGKSDEEILGRIGVGLPEFQSICKSFHVSYENNSLYTEQLREVS